MIVYSPIIACKDEIEENHTLTHFDLFFDTAIDNDLSLDYKQSHGLVFDYILHQISKTPSKIITHIQRIYFCYKQNLSDQLFAALVDLFVVLNGKGFAIRQRMFDGCKSKLTNDEKKQLQLYLDKQQIPEFNQYCILADGVIGTPCLVNVNKDINVPEQDTLSIARDFIEYSQLDQAQEMLEDAVTENSHRKEIHLELLQLYQSTGDKPAFLKMYGYVKQQNNPMLTLWDEFNSQLTTSHE